MVPYITHMVAEQIQRLIMTGGEYHVKFCMEQVCHWLLRTDISMETESDHSIHVVFPAENVHLQHIVHRQLTFQVRNKPRHHSTASLNVTILHYTMWPLFTTPPPLQSHRISFFSFEGSWLACSDIPKLLDLVKSNWSSIYQFLYELLALLTSVLTSLLHQNVMCEIHQGISTILQVPRTWPLTTHAQHCLWLSRGIE